ncbi:uncharacterized protein LOC131928760 [Physella acuta]|uniref:uncharacterized protein LOC131928760 n=1 Tax=Physella acuta TaxID=109671 RepID=UPI0027DAC86D|nr:uncharacterized protein LOC131928760 [Physella acuta]
MASHAAFNIRQKTDKGQTLYQEMVQRIIQRFIYDNHRQIENTVGSDDVKSCFDRMRQEVLAQYKVKDDSLDMAISAVRWVSKNMEKIQGKESLNRDELFPWKKSDSIDSQDSALTPDHPDSEFVSNVDHHDNALCDIHEEPIQVHNKTKHSKSNG